MRNVKQLVAVSRLFVLAFTTLTVALAEPPIKNVFVYKEPGRFAGHPANRGIWIWGNQILVGFSDFTYKDSKGHSRDNDKGSRELLARSRDGGETWTVEDPKNYVGDGGKPVPSPGGVEFTHSDFALRLNKDTFFVSYDRGKTWKGPYRLPTFGHELSARTDYIVNGPRDALFFVSAKEPRVKTPNPDRAFCMRTTDGGKTFQFVSWMTGDPITSRSVMPSTVRISKTQLVSALRRRDDTGGSKNWIDIYASNDDGASWTFLSKVVDMGANRNGNPPSMIRLRDGRLCVTYGLRNPPFGIRANISSDKGKTWGDEIVLRKDGRTWDLGYPRTVERPDGKVVTIYYFTTQENPENHIAATIWDPSSLAKKH